MVGIALLHQHVAVEAAHLRDGEDADAAEGAGLDRQDLALGDVGAQLALAVALQAVEGDLGGSDVALQGAPGEVGVGALGLQQAVLDELILHGPVGAQLAAGGVAAVEAHEGVGELIGELALDVLVVQVGGDGVVDVQQGDRVAGDAHADVLGQGAVDVHLAGDGDAPAHQAGVHIAGLKAELLGEGGPALVGKGHVLPGALVLLRPVQQGDLQLGHALVHLGVVAALAHLLGHVGADLGDAGVVLVGLVGHQQIQLGVLLDLHADLIQALDGGVAGKEVLGTGAEGDDLQLGQADEGAGDGHIVLDHGGDVLGGAHGVLGDVGLQVAHAQVVGAVEHAAVGVAPAVDQVLAGLLGGGGVHDGAVKLLGDEGLGGLGAEVAQEHHQGVAAGGLHLVHGLEHVLLVLHGGLALVDVHALGLAGGHHRGAAALRQGDDEAVPGHRDDAQLYSGNVGQHNVLTPLLKLSRFR